MRYREKVVRTITLAAVTIASAMHGLMLAAQDKPDAPADKQSSEIQVNWLYGAYLPRDVPLEPLSTHQRGSLYLRQTYLTYGIYLKTAFFALGDQATGSPPEWGGGMGGYGKRISSRFGQFAIQNTLSTAGNLFLQYEPRYDRCRCDGFGPRIRHALERNFVTYNKTERELRPQIGLYAGAMGAGMIASTWKPSGAGLWREGYQSMVTQAAFGSFANVLGEFAPEIVGMLRRKKKKE
jgi:hypothetical protein